MSSTNQDGRGRPSYAPSAVVFLSALADIEFAASFSWWEAGTILLGAGFSRLVKSSDIPRAEAMPPSRLNGCWMGLLPTSSSWWQMGSRLKPTDSGGRPPWVETHGDHRLPLCGRNTGWVARSERSDPQEIPNVNNNRASTANSAASDKTPNRFFNRDLSRTRI